MRSLKERAALLELRAEQMRIALDLHPEPALRATWEFTVARLRRYRWHLGRRGLLDEVPPVEDPRAA